MGKSFIIASIIFITLFQCKVKDEVTPIENYEFFELRVSEELRTQDSIHLIFAFQSVEKYNQECYFDVQIQLNSENEININLKEFEEPHGCRSILNASKKGSASLKLSLDDYKLTINNFGQLVYGEIKINSNTLEVIIPDYQSVEYLN